MKQFSLEFVAVGDPGVRFSAGVASKGRARFRAKIKKEGDARSKRREAKRALRAAVADHGAETVRVRAAGAEAFGLRAAIQISPLLSCSRCGAIVRERDLVGGLCEPCAYGGVE